MGAMYRLYPYLLSLILIDSSCRYGKDYVIPVPDLPASFSYKPAAVQISEIYRDNLLREKDSYRNGHVAGQQYILINEKPTGN